MGNFGFRIGLLVCFLVTGWSTAHSQVVQSEVIYHQTDSVEYRLHISKNDTIRELRPAIVFFHGWGKVRDPEQFFPFCTYYAEKGLVGISAEYRKDQADWKTALENALLAMNWVKDHAQDLGIDKSKIILSGGSGGGWTAASVTTTSRYLHLDAQLQEQDIPVAMVLFNPLLSALDEIGQKLQMTSEYSPLHNLDREQPPLLILTGSEDFLLHQSLQYEKKTKELGNMISLKIYKGGKHGFFNYGKHGNKYYHLTLQEIDAFLAHWGLLP